MPCKPFLKWAGGKRRLVPELSRRLPAQIGTYLEPFVGGGALFFALSGTGRWQRAVLSDANAELVLTYQAVRDDVEGVIRELSRHVATEEHYYAVRALTPADLSRTESAARMIYLNRTCYGGVYRVNAAGKFTGTYSKDQRGLIICRPDNLRAASAALDGVEIMCCDFETAMGLAGAGDAVYCDPPYVPLGATSNFTSYTPGKFRHRDQELLRSAADCARARGASVLASNSDTQAARDIWSGWNVDVVHTTQRLYRCNAGSPFLTELLIS